MEFVFSQSESLFSMLGSLGLLFAGYIAQRFLIPFLNVGRRQKYAQYIAAIADELTDALRARHPEKEWLAHLDEAVDTLAAICGVSIEIARRAIKASAARK